MAGEDVVANVRVKVEAEVDEQKTDAAGKKAGQKWADSFVKSIKDRVDKSADTPLGKTLFGSQTYNIRNQPMGYQGGILSGAANSINTGMLLKLGMIAAGVGVVVDLLAKASPALQKEMGMFESAMKLFFRPFGDMLATLLRPALIWLIKMGVLWYQLFKNPTNKAALTAIFDPIVFGAQMASLLTKVLTDPKTWDDIGTTLNKAWDKIRVSAGDVAQIVYNYWTWIDNKATEIWGGIKTTIKTIWDGLASIITTPLQKIVDFVNGITWPSWLGGESGNGGGGGGGGSSSGYYMTPENPNNYDWGSVPSGSGGYFGGGEQTIDVQAFAGGGIVTQPQLAMVGESGPEAIIPLSKLKGGGTTVNIDISIQAMDKTQIINEVTRELSMELRRRLSVYG